MPAISTKNDIELRKCRAYADGNGFLSDRKVDRALNTVRWIKAYYFFFHATDAVKLAVEVFVANVGHSWSRKLELGDLRRLFLRCAY